MAFDNNSAINILLRTPALSNMKSVHVEVFQIIKKLEKIKRSVSINSPKKKLVPLVVMTKEEDEQQARIDELTKENVELRRMMKIWGIVLLCLYVVTVVLLMI